MNRLARLAQLVGLNAIPVIGVSFANWASPTALVLYWCETVMLVVPPLSVPLPIFVEPSKNVTVPVGVPPLPLTVAVKVTG